MAGWRDSSAQDAHKPWISIVVWSTANPCFEIFLISCSITPPSSISSIRPQSWHIVKMALSCRCCGSAQATYAFFNSSRCADRLASNDLMLDTRWAAPKCLSAGRRREFRTRSSGHAPTGAPGRPARGFRTAGACGSWRFPCQGRTSDVTLTCTGKAPLRRAILPGETRGCGPSNVII